MKDAMKKILTDKSVRTPKRISKEVLKSAKAGHPWAD